ncbi:unnamed protein product [Leptidea sinapis]|uniref:Uncharacterized protein n=1 Tax=Leptidea sinapis TaxID=189913 RepID=A0A5E4QZN5_9NEOP|nr:unnamed protein product [Leptidea sinapis]
MFKSAEKLEYLIHHFVNHVRHNNLEFVEHSVHDYFQFSFIWISPSFLTNSSAALLSLEMCNTWLKSVFDMASKSILQIKITNKI